MAATTSTSTSTNTSGTTTNSSNLVKVIGYAQREFYNNGIEYRNFSDDLVGNQQTSSSDGNGDSVFTIQNFVTTTNFEGRLTRTYDGKKYSDFQTLETLNLTVERANSLLNNNVSVEINMDNTDLCNFAFFGSATEFIRVSLENIITNWVASLYLTPLRDGGNDTEVGPTVEHYSYSTLTNSSAFFVDSNFINNKFNIIYQENGTTIDTFNETNDLRNLTINYLSYVIDFEGETYPIITYTPPSSMLDSTLYFEVMGNPFDFTGTSYNISYHIRPNDELVEEFFNSLNGFEDNLLNRLVIPKYTSEYNYKVEGENGVAISRNRKLTWPTSDGYNIDFNTNEYINFVTQLLNISNSKDGLETDLMTRFLTSSSISDFDTIPRCNGVEEETSGQKMNKTLKIYGREFDELKKYMDGISFANVVTYDKKNNIPDQLVKYLARTMGWELVSSLVDENLISSYLAPQTNYYAGQTRGLTPQEADVEMWRRLILNSAWIWKSKGTRKAVEFFFKFVGAPDGLISFNEYIYLASNPIDMNLFYAVLENNNLDTDLSLYNIDRDGYPILPKNTPNMYFQKGGQWYRETGGENTNQHISIGNNPHIGPYDSGREYINQLRNIIPDFTPFTLEETTTETVNNQLFNNYINGVFNDYGGDFYVDVIDENGLDFSEVVTITSEIITDPCPEPLDTNCGCPVDENDEAIKISFSIREEAANICDDLFSSVTYDEDDNLWIFEYTLYTINGLVDVPTNTSIYAPQECCIEIGGNPYYHEEWELLNPYEGVGVNVELQPTVPNSDEAIFGDQLNEGYICCKSQGIIIDWTVRGCGCVLSCQWQVVSEKLKDMYIVSGNEIYLRFIDAAGNHRVVNEADSCFCPIDRTIPTVILDPHTGKMGYACKLRNNTYLGSLYRMYQMRARKQIDCNEDK
tara:strand:+ start:66710 stop:69463 length:2754 start_codon:yes stop_codon:yes gene_type:complete